ncbi:LytTR family DNA-binding domain-containing protein [Sphingomonas sp.]|uniref:LytTR family DNA-binding domain-containing protein n=1 Tax=Sphingomonas sp. TaxID=28214 RepID=UPI003BACC214
MSTVRQILIELAVMVAIGVVLALIGPFGSFAASFGWRLLYWVPVIVAGYLIYRPIGAAASWLGHRLQLPIGPMWLVATLVATVPMTMLVWATGCSGICRPPESIDRALIWYGQVLVIGGAVTFLLYLRSPRGAAAPLPAEERSPDSPPEPASAAAMPGSPFLDRLPPHLGTTLIALEMEDHYVRAHTAVGSDLILMRMRDAIGELAGVPGMQVHRSWWVAQTAVAAVERDGRNVRLELSNGLRAPVSRERVAALRETGWI